MTRSHVADPPRRALRGNASPSRSAAFALALATQSVAIGRSHAERGNENTVVLLLRTHHL
jgi:hypothetical protein